MIPSPPPRFEPLRSLAGSRPVFQALDRVTGRIVHLKLGRSRDDSLREARLLTRVAGPFSPALICLIRDGDRRWLASEWVEGRPLSERPPPAPSWPAELLRILSHIHRHDVVHGDLKPGNVLCRPDGTLCLVDFEFARRGGDDVHPRSGGGTRGFVAPERFTGWPADPRSDLYSLGRTIEALTRPSPEEAKLLTRLTAQTPAGRPARAGTLLSEFARVYGMGHIPVPDLARAGWSGVFPGTDRLARGLQVWLGVDAFAACRIAEELLAHSGGIRSVAQEIMRRWLRDRCVDPWCDRSPEDGIESRSGLMAAVEAAAHESFNQLTPEARTILGRLAHLTSPLIDGLTPPRIDVTSDAGFKSAGSALDDLKRSHMLVAGKGGHGPLHFVSRVHRRLALDLLPAGEAATLHRHAIAGIRRGIRGGANSLALKPRLAWHLERAGGDRGRREAFEQLGAATDLAAAAGRPDLAFRAMEEAVRLMDDTPGQGSQHFPAWVDTFRWGGRLLRFAERLSVRGRAAAARRLVEEIRASAGAADVATEAELVLAELDIREQKREEALASADRLLQPDRPLCAPLRARAGHVRTRALIGLGRLTESLAALDDLISSGGPDIEPTASILITRGLIAHRRGHLVAARKEWVAALRMARRRGWSYPECGALVNLAIDHAGRQRTGRAVRYLRRAADLAHREGYIKIEWEAVSNLTELALRRERWREAMDLGERGRRLALEAGVRIWGARALMRLARIHLRRGRLRTAESLLAETYEMLPGVSAPGEKLASLLQRFEVDLWYRQRRPDDGAWQEAARLAGGPCSHRAGGELRILSALRALHDGATAAEILPDLVELPDDPDLVGWHRLARARVRGAAGDMAGARADLLGALERWRRPGGSRHDEAFALLELGRLEGSGEPGAGRAHLEEAIHLARHIGARWIEATASIERLALEPARPGPAAVAHPGGIGP